MPSRSTVGSFFRADRRAAFTSFKAYWVDLCATAAFSGRWVAVDKVSYRPQSEEPHEVEVVDADDDLAALVSRMRKASRTSCSVLQCKRSRTRYHA